MAVSPWSASGSKSADGKYVDLTISTDCPNGRAWVTPGSVPGQWTFAQDTDGRGSFTLGGISSSDPILGGFAIATSCGSTHSITNIPITQTPPPTPTPPPGGGSTGPITASGSCVGKTSTDLLICLGQNPPNILHPGDVLSWLGNVALGIGGILSSGLTIAWTGFTDALSAFWNSIFNGWVGFWSKIVRFMADPYVGLRKIVTGILSEASDSIIMLFIKGLQLQILTFLIGSAAADYITNQAQNNPVVQVQQLGATVGEQIATPTTPEGVQARIQQLDQLVSPVVLGLMSAQTAMDKVPTLNQTGTAAFTLSWLEARGIFSAVRGVVEPYIAHNISKNLDYQLNAFYQNTIPDLATLIAMKYRGWLGEGDFVTMAPRISGIQSGLIQSIANNSLQLPGFDEFITYNRRHPNAPLALSTIANLAGLEWTRYPQVFEERQYSDLSMRYVQNAANLLDFTEAQVTELLRLTALDSRVNATLGMSPLEVAVKVVMARKALYLQGQQGVTPKSKHFTYSLLIKLAESGQNITGFMDEDLKDEGWDDAHRTVLEGYINSVVAAKAAKATTANAT